MSSSIESSPLTCWVVIDLIWLYGGNLSRLETITQNKRSRCDLRQKLMWGWSCTPYLFLLANQDLRALIMVFKIFLDIFSRFYSLKFQENCVMAWWSYGVGKSNKSHRHNSYGFGGWDIRYIAPPSIQSMALFLIEIIAEMWKLVNRKLP